MVAHPRPCGGVRVFWSLDRHSMFQLSKARRARRATGWWSRQVLISGESGGLFINHVTVFKCIKDCSTDSLACLTMSERVPPAAAGMLHGIVLALQHSILAYHFGF